MMAATDPEIAELVATTRSLVGEMFRLTRDLDAVVDELVPFTARRDDLRGQLERRDPNAPPYQGRDRRDR